MPPKVVVVVRPSPSEPCGKCHALSLTPAPFCPQCGTLQEFPEGLSHFAVLGVPVSLALEESALRERFYELSKKIHPDRFSQSGATEARHALRWSTAINRAYQTLRDRERRAHYYLDLFSPQRVSSTTVPLELAESYFELQDLLTEPEGVAQLGNFQKDLQGQLAAVDADWDTLAATFGASPDAAALLRLENFLSKRRYLESMLTDLAKRLAAVSPHARE